jgi:hypothetical protein
VSNTPQQALTLLNDPSFMEAARAFAGEIVDFGGDSLESRIEFAAKHALSRVPTDAERKILSDLYAQQRAEYELNPVDVDAVLAIGQWRAPESVDRVELAAWTQVVRVLMNTQEAITRY